MASFNLVVPFNYYTHKFHEDSVDKKTWEPHYPSLFDYNVWDQINSKVVPAVGYLYLRVISKDEFVFAGIL